MIHGLLWILLALSTVILVVCVGLLARGMLHRRPRKWSAKLVVHRRRDHASGWFTLTLRRAFPLGWMPLPAFRAGQSIAVSMEGQETRRHYSLARWSPRPASYELTIKPLAHGKLSAWLAQHAVPGAVVHVESPKGSFGLDTAVTAQRQVLIAGGVGITPLLAMVDQWCLSPHSGRPPLHLFWQTQQSCDWIYRDVLDAHTRSTPGLHVHLLASRATDGTARRIDMALLRQELGDISHTRFVLCASQAMMDDLAEQLRAAGVVEKNVVCETFGAASTTPTGTWRMTVDGQTILYDNHRNLLEALEDAHIAVPSDCRAGTCGQCTIEVVQGSTYPLFKPEHDTRPGFVLACCCAPLSDMELRLHSP